jgi:predicted ABC-type exoprotein transport system permease subunit
METQDKKSVDINWLSTITLAVSILVTLCALVSLVVSFCGLRSFLHEGDRVDSSVLSYLTGISFQWWLTLALQIRIAGLLLPRLYGRLLSLTGLLGAIALFVGWVSWSVETRENVVSGFGLTTKLLVSGNVFSYLTLGILALNAILEGASAIARRPTRASFPPAI